MFPEKILGRSRVYSTFLKQNGRDKHDTSLIGGVFFQVNIGVIIMAGRPDWLKTIADNDKIWSISDKGYSFWLICYRYNIPGTPFNGRDWTITTLIFCLMQLLIHALISTVVTPNVYWSKDTDE